MKAALANLKLYAGLAVTAAIGVLYFMLGRRTEQRDEQRRRADRAQGNHQASETRREDERRRAQAQAEARDHNEQAERERNEKPKDSRRTGRLGGADRLRNYDAKD